MKKFVILLVLPMFAAFYSNAQSNTMASVGEAPVKAAPANPNAPVATWDKVVNDFGDIVQGVPKEAVFTLTNTGKEPLIISSAKASCGCTNSQYSHEPILEGKSGTVSATYNAASPGIFAKTITVVTNADTNPIILQIRGNVVAKQ